MIREFLLAREREINAAGGYVNKYVGDEIVTVFGFPLREEGATSRAVGTALAMLDSFTALRASWIRRGVPPLRAIGIGIVSGAVSFAEMGGSTRSQFDAVGDAVNGAARLQSHSKEALALVVVSEAVRATVADSIPAFAAGCRSVEADIRGQGRRRLYAYGTLEPGRGSSPGSSGQAPRA